MKNNEKILLSEILRVQELMGLKQLINEQGGKYEPVVEFFKSMLNISVKDLKFKSIFDEAFEHIKTNNSELIEKVRKSLGANDISVDGLKGLKNLSTITASELKTLMESLQREMISYIFTKYTDDFIELGDELISNSLINKPNLKSAYDHMVNLAERGEAKELQTAIQNARKMNAFPSYVLDHIQNTKFIQKTGDAALDAIEKSGDDLVNAVSNTVVDSVQGIVKGLKVVGGKIVGLGNILKKGAQKIKIDNLLDAIEYMGINFNKSLFIRGYKGLADDIKLNELYKRADELNVRFAELIKSGDDASMEELEMEIAKFLDDSNRWLLATQKNIINYWKTNLTQICKDEGIPDEIDRFFGKVQSDGTTKFNIITPELRDAIEDAIKVQGQVIPKNYIGALDGFKRMLPIFKSWRADKRSVKTFFERFTKLLAYGDPRLFSETADNIVYSKGFKGWLKKEAKRRVLFAFVYWHIIYTAQDAVKAYVVGTQDPKSWLYNFFINNPSVLTPNTKYPENRQNDDKFTIYKRWIMMSIVNYLGINSKVLSDSYIGTLTGIEGDKEWETLNTPTADELKNNPELAKERLDRRGEMSNKFIHSYLYAFLNWLEYQNVGSAQTGTEAKANGYIETQMSDFAKDPNVLKLDTAQQKIVNDSMRSALENAKGQMRKYMDSAESDFSISDTKQKQK